MEELLRSEEAMIERFFCVSCDECGARAPFEGARASTTLERNISEHGWECQKDGKDLCPECIEKVRVGEDELDMSHL